MGFQPTPNDPFRTCIPSNMLQQFIQWYHKILSHTGMHNLFHTINLNFYHPKLRQECQQFVSTCDYCQRYKVPIVNYGLLPPRQTTMTPWHNIATDLIGPWNIPICNQNYQFRAITIIDIDTNLTEAAIIDNCSSQHIAQQFEHLWITRYPAPQRCIHDNGNEFLGYPFQTMLINNHIHDVPTTIKNPQAHSICERIHQTMGNMLRILIHERPPTNYQDARLICQLALDKVLYSLRNTFHSTLRTTPGALAFNQDFLLNIPVITDLENIKQRRQQIINANNTRENNRRIPHQYNIGDQILIKVPTPSKLQERFTGPHPITQVHDNGTITIQLQPNITQTINIRRVKPYNN